MGIDFISVTLIITTFLWLFSLGYLCFAFIALELFKYKRNKKVFSDNFSLFGIPEYHAQASQGTYNKKRRKTEMRVEMPYNEYLYFDCYISNINSSGMYNINNYIDVGISIRFGIDY